MGLTALFWSETVSKLILQCCLTKDRFLKLDVGPLKPERDLKTGHGNGSIRHTNHLVETQAKVVQKK